nr:PREDICTED: synaptic vesicle glycoprotein 2A [Apteryx mantelli mantelli]
MVVRIRCVPVPRPPGLIVYLGMMVGAFLWGGLADRLGRRQCLLISLSVNSVFAFFSSFVQGYGTFLFCRLLSGVGIGGSIPIVFSYFSEFLAQEKRGEHLSWLCMFWMIGGIYASAMAWAIIPHYGWSFQMGSAYQFHSWRVFVLVCAFPSVFAIGALTTMPEPPGSALQNGKHDEAWMVLKQVHDTNMRAKGHPERVFSVTHIKTIKREDELIEIQADTGTWYRRWLVRFLNLSQQVWSNFQQCFAPEYRRVTLMMMAVWFTMSFSYYGLTVWFPDMIKHLQSIEYASRTKLFTREKVKHFTFNFTLENQIHRNGEYFNDKFIGLKMKSVIFEDSLFEECYFEDITSSNTFFKNCTFISTVFYNTDLFEYKFIESRVLNSTFLHNKEGCQLDFSDDNTAYMVYFVSFLGTLAVLPGNIVSALLMDKIGRLRMLAGSSVMSCVSCFFLSFGNSESAMIALLCLFGGVSIASWNALDVRLLNSLAAGRRRESPAGKRFAAGSGSLPAAAAPAENSSRSPRCRQLIYRPDIKAPDKIRRPRARVAYIRREDLSAGTGGRSAWRGPGVLGILTAIFILIPILLLVSIPILIPIPVLFLSPFSIFIPIPGPIPIIILILVFILVFSPLIPSPILILIPIFILAFIPIPFWESP